MNQTAGSDVLELRETSSRAVAAELESHGHENGTALPLCDRGYRAWRLLFTIFVFEALLWGFPLSFGVFQNYYSQLPEFRGSPYISVIGTTATGIIYMAAPVMIAATKRLSRYRQQMIWVGWPICLLSLVVGSFAKSLATLILTQGVIYAIGFIIFYYPMLSMVNEFWVERRGMAYGILCGASGVSGAVTPFVMNELLRKYGYPTTLRATAIALFVLTGPLIPLLKGRLPESETNRPERTDWSFIRTWLFWVYSASNLAMGLAYFFPSLYLPSYATANNLGSTAGAILLAVMSVSQVLGQFMFGYLSDKKVSLNLLILTSTVISAIAIYSLWGLGHSIGILIAFSIIYGFFAAGYTAVWARMGMAISAEPTAAFASFGLLNLGKGVGNILAGPISGALLRRTINVGAYGATRYELVIIFTGVCMFLSAAIIPLSFVKPKIHIRCS